MKRLHVLVFTSLFRTPAEKVRAPFTSEFLSVTVDPSGRAVIDTSGLFGDGAAQYDEFWT